MMSNSTEMEVDQRDDTPLLPKTTVTIITPSPKFVLSIPSSNQQRVIQAMPTTVTTDVRPPRLQIVRLVTPSHQQHVLRASGGPVRLITTANSKTSKIQIAPTQLVGSVNSLQQKVSASQRLILPANSKPSNSQIVTIPVTHNTAKIQKVLTSVPTMFTTSQPGTSQPVLAILSPHKPETSTPNQTENILSSGTVASTSTVMKTYNMDIDDSDIKTEPSKKETVPDSSSRKPCNCTKSHCLKLYCDCFARGEFCSNCNCINCANILSKEEQRQKAIKQCLLRNPHAFHPKIGKGESAQVRRHQKGCNCKRSGCLKNYCECFEARILCGIMCKCVGCKNCEENSGNVSLMRLADAAMVRTMHQSSTSDRLSQTKQGAISLTSGSRQRESLKAHLTDTVIEGVMNCLIAQCREAEVAKCKPDTTQKLILEEFGRCVNKIIKSSSDIPLDS